MELSATKLGKKYKTSPLIFFDDLTIMAGGAGGGEKFSNGAECRGNFIPLFMKVITYVQSQI